MRKITKRNIELTAKEYSKLITFEHHKDNLCILLDNATNTLGCFDLNKANQLVEKYDFVRFIIVTTRNYEINNNELTDLINYSKNEYIVNDINELKNYYTTNNKSLWEYVESYKDDIEYYNYLIKLFELSKHTHLVYNNKSYCNLQKNIKNYKYCILSGVCSKFTNSKKVIEAYKKRNANCIVLEVLEVKENYIKTNNGIIAFCYHTDNCNKSVLFDDKLNKKYQKERLIKHLTCKYQYNEEKKENKQVFINILCNMLKMQCISISNFYYVYEYFLLNYVNNEIEKYIDNEGLKASTYKQNKINYHHQEHKKHNLIKSLLQKYQYENNHTEKKQILINILMNILVLKGYSLLKASENFTIIYNHAIYSCIYKEINKYIANDISKIFQYKEAKNAYKKVLKLKVA